MGCLFTLRGGFERGFVLRDYVRGNSLSDAAAAAAATAAATTEIDIEKESRQTDGRTYQHRPCSSDVRCSKGL